jgi:hypothetical protein
VALTDAKWNGVDPVDVLVGLVERPAWHKDTAACRSPLAGNHDNAGNSLQ